MKPTPDFHVVANEINRLHAVAVRNALDSRNSLRRALSAAWRAGGLLIEAKKDVRRRMGPGAWLPWLEQRFGGSARTAQRYMCLARSVDDTGALRGLSLRQAYFRLGISTEPKSRRDAIYVAALPEPVRLASRLFEVLRSTPAQGYCEDLRPLFEQLRTLFEQANNLPAAVSIGSPSSESRADRRKIAASPDDGDGRERVGGAFRPARPECCAVRHWLWEDFARDANQRWAEDEKRKSTLMSGT